MIWPARGSLAATTHSGTATAPHAFGMGGINNGTIISFGKTNPGLDHIGTGSNEFPCSLRRFF